MTEQHKLNRLEHHLLSMQVDDIEPLFILYADTMRDIKGATLNRILKALIKLIDMGFSECTLEEDGRLGNRHSVTFDEL